LIIAPGSESKSRPGLLRPDGLTDIPVFVISVFLSTQSHDPHAVIECKRISEGDARLVREYVSQGIDRFRTAKYASDHRIGFMVGYVIAGTALGAVDRVNAYLAKNGRPAEQLSAAVILENERIWVSEHPRPGKRPPVHLHHTMANVSEVDGAMTTSPTASERQEMLGT
jgi:hypothetical protein